MTGNIEFGDNSHAAVTRIGNHVTNLGLRVVQAVGTVLLETGILLAFDSEPLVIRQVPVQDIQLHG